MKKWLVAHRDELAVHTIIVVLLALAGLLWNAVTGQFGQYKVLLVLLILFLLLVLFALFVFLMRSLSRRLVIQPIVAQIGALIASQNAPASPSEPTIPSEGEKRISTLVSNLEETFRDYNNGVNSKLDMLIDVLAKSVGSTHEKIDTLAPRVENLIKDHSEGLSSSHEAVMKKLEDHMGTLHAVIQGGESKYEKLTRKYKHVDFKEKNSINEFDPSEANAVKIGLMKGVEHSVHAIHRIEKLLPLPLQTTDDWNYFKDNQKALERIRQNHPDNREEYNIHRIFVVSQEALDVSSLVHAMKLKIQEHLSAGFDVMMALRSELEEPPTFEFAIYDNEIALRLSVNEQTWKYGAGIVNFDEAVWKAQYQRRYNSIKAKSCTPEEFWHRYSVESL